ncbi:MAG: hypothetical protein PHV11_08530 [Candidatus Bipolaricaulis sp.]|nr:hypothetical protein [Candidatus Bipolaricaulis sp.]
MAHRCPECGQLCFCGGDIDDICFDYSEYEDNCLHCILPEEVAWEEATRQAQKHEKQSVADAVSARDAEFDRLHQICLDLMRERDEAVERIYALKEKEENDGKQ